jgi:hypothetical protein
MNHWFAIFSAMLCVAAGMTLGRWFSKLRSPCWLLGYFIPLAVILTYAFMGRFPSVPLPAPMTWMLAGQKKFALLGFVVTLILTTPLSRMPQKRDRLVVSILMVAMVFLVSIWPLLTPMFNRKQLTGLQTRINNDGVCLQTRNTPAARRQL